MSERLPNGWKWVRLGEVCEFLDGMRIPVNDAERQKRILGKEQSELYPYYGANGQIGWIDGYLFDEELVLLAEDGGFFGSSEKPIAYRVSGKCWVNNHAHVLRAKRGIVDVDWLYFSLAIRPDVIQFVSGTTRPKLNQKQAILIPIPLPPLHEQKRIATKLQELMQEVERARTACEKQLEAVKALPSAYLREVFESEEAKKWERKRLGEVCKTTSGGTPHRGHIEYFYGNIPWVKSGELKDGYINDTEEKITKLGLDNSNAKVLPTGTLLIAMYGATVGKLGILEIAAATNQAICAILPNSNVLTDFLFFFFLYYRKDLINKSYGGAQPNISQELIRKTLIPMPAINDQHRIATYLNEKMAYVEKLKVSIEKQLEAINALPQAILRKAFRGEL